MKKGDVFVSLSPPHYLPLVSQRDLVLLEDQDPMQVLCFLGRKKIFCFIFSPALPLSLRCADTVAPTLAGTLLSEGKWRRWGHTSLAAGSSHCSPLEQGNGGLLPPPPPPPLFQWAGSRARWSRSWIITVQWNLSITHNKCLSHNSAVPLSRQCPRCQDFEACASL